MISDGGKTMTVEQFTTAHKSDARRYYWHISQLESCTDIDSFRSLSRALFDDILSDERDISELYKNGPVSKPIEDRITYLRKTYHNAVQTYSDFKSICL